MADLVVVVPSRGRPAAALELVAAFAATCAADTELVFAVDDDDPTLAEYEAAVPGVRAQLLNGAERPGFPAAVGPVPGSTSMVYALNWAARAVVEMWNPQPFALGFLGDDHRPRTVGWDAAYLEALRGMGTGIVYGDDLLQRRNLPTQCAMTADIVRALGYMAPPTLTHLYVDNFWLSLGRSANCIRYLSDVVVEHCHPVARKAEWDAGYARVNNSNMYAKDEAAFRGYSATGFRADVEKVLALRAGVTTS